MYFCTKFNLTSFLVPFTTSIFFQTRFGLEFRAESIIGLFYNSAQEARKIFESLYFRKALNLYFQENLLLLKNIFEQMQLAVYCIAIPSPAQVFFYSCGLGEHTSCGFGEHTSCGFGEHTSCGFGEHTSCGFSEHIAVGLASILTVGLASILMRKVVFLRNLMVVTYNKKE